MAFSCSFLIEHSRPVYQFLTAFRSANYQFRYPSNRRSSPFAIGQKPISENVRSRYLSRLKRSQIDSISLFCVRKIGAVPCTKQAVKNVYILSMPSSRKQPFFLSKGGISHQCGKLRPLVEKYPIQVHAIWFRYLKMTLQRVFFRIMLPATKKGRSTPRPFD